MYTWRLPHLRLGESLEEFGREPHRVPHGNDVGFWDLDRGHGLPGREERHGVGQRAHNVRCKRVVVVSIETHGCAHFVFAFV